MRKCYLAGGGGPDYHLLARTQAAHHLGRASLLEAVRDGPVRSVIRAREAHAR